MATDLQHPLAVLVGSFLVLWFAARVGYSLLRRRRVPAEEARNDFDVILTATLTLLGLIIGFSFSMAVSRYDLRKNFEEAEANAIDTELARADLLPPAKAAKVRTLLRKYLDQRVLFYVTPDEQQLRELNAGTALLQGELWSTVRAAAAAQPNAVVALAVAGMNDVLNSQGCAQAAFWNRIPRGAWALMAVMAIICNLLLGYGVRDKTGTGTLLVVLPLVVPITFLLIADIDSPRGGFIHVKLRNLLSLSESVPAQ
jgi:hypothetical protein